MNPALVFAAAWVGGAYWVHRRRRHSADWRELARALRIPFRDLGAAGIELEMSGTDRAIHVEEHRRGVRLWTRYPVAGGPSFCLAPKAHTRTPELAALERRFGPTVWLDRASAFEHRYWILSRDPDRTCEVLRDDALGLADALLEEIPGVTLQSSRSVVELWIPDPQPDATGAHRVLSMLGDLAQRDICGLSALLRLPGAILLTCADAQHEAPAPVVALPPSQGAARFRPHADDGVVVTEVFGRASGADRAWRAHVDEHGTLTGDVPRGSIPVAAAIELPRVGRGVLSCCDGEVVFRWSRLIGEKATLLAGARLIAAFAPSR